MIIATAGRTMYALGALDGGLYTAVQTYDGGATAIVSVSTERTLLDTIHFNTTEHGTGLDRAIQFAQDAILDDDAEAACEQAWRAYCATHTLPDDIPANPDEVYASEWRGWCDWIGAQGIDS